jgi:hypothetical protein
LWDPAANRDLSRRIGSAACLSRTANDRFLDLFWHDSCALHRDLSHNHAQICG